MSNQALALYESTRPLESLESFIFRTAQRVSRGDKKVMSLREVSNNEGSLEFAYEVDQRSALQPEEWGAVGGFAVAAALAVRAALTRKAGHVLAAASCVQPQ